MRKTISVLLLCLLAGSMMTGCTANAAEHIGEAEGYGGTLRVTVKMNGEDVTEVKVVEHHETEGVGTRAIDALPEAIEKADSIDVDSVSGATVTSEAIKEAVSKAMGMTGVVQQVIPMNGDAAKADALPVLSGMGMAATGRIGPGSDAEGKQVYSFNVVFACGEFEQDGVIRRIKVDQLEVVSPNLGGASVFSGFPEAAADEDAFLAEVAAWVTKGAQRENYKLASGSWREQMDAYEAAMVGKTVAGVKEWYAARGQGDGEATAQPDAAAGATMALQGEYGDILLAIERAWADAQKDAAPESTLVDTNTLPEEGEAESTVG